MASISVPCPKCSVTARYGAWSRNWIRKSTPPDSFLKPAPEPSSLSGSAWVLSSKVPSRGHFPILKAHFQEVDVVSSSNSSSLVSTKSESTPIKGEDSSMVEESANEDAVTDTTISAFMAEVSNLVKLVDSKDITELHLKTEACDLLIRKKEALPQPPVASAPVIMQYPQTMLPPQPSAHVFPSAQSNPVAASPAPALPPPPTTGSKSSLPPLKSPMAGTLYRCPAPVLFVLRPLIYVLFIRKYGIQSWKPWLISLAMDLAGMSFLSYSTTRCPRSDDKYYQLTTSEKYELKRRKLLWALYIMRDPFFTKYTKHCLEKTDEYLSPVPLIGFLTDKFVELVVGVQTRYTYISGS